MTDPQIKFGPLPERAPKGARRSRKWEKVAEDLRARPGEWALVDPSSRRSVTTQIKQGLLKSFAPAGSFDATTRGGDGSSRSVRVQLYARYVGEVSDQKPADS